MGQTTVKPVLWIWNIELDLILTKMLLTNLTIFFAYMILFYLEPWRHIRFQGHFLENVLFEFKVTFN